LFLFKLKLFCVQRYGKKKYLPNFLQNKENIAKFAAQKE